MVDDDPLRTIKMLGSSVLEFAMSAFVVILVDYDQFRIWDEEAGLRI